MLDHRTAAARRAPRPRQRVARSYSVHLLADSTGAFGLALTGRRRRISVVLHTRLDRGWTTHLVHVELLRLRVQTWTPVQGGELA